MLPLELVQLGNRAESGVSPLSRDISTFIIPLPTRLILPYILSYFLNRSSLRRLSSPDMVSQEDGRGSGEETAQDDSSAIEGSEGYVRWSGLQHLSKWELGLERCILIDQ